MRLSTLLLGVPAVIAAVVVAVANRQSVSFSFDPFSHTAPVFAFDIPLFLLLFAAVGLGAVLGGVAAFVSRPARQPAAAKEPPGKPGTALLPGRGPGSKPPPA